MKRMRCVVMILLSIALLLGSLSCGKVTGSQAAPPNLTKTTNNNMPTFTWNAGNDKDSGVSFYLVNIDGQGWWNIGNVTTYQCRNPLSDGSHTFQVKAVDNAGNKGTAASLTFICDTTPPTVSSVSTSGITAYSATVTWTTNEPASSEVEYGLTSAYGSNTTVDSTLVTSHSVKVTGLEPNTIYHYRVRSGNGSGNEALSGDQSVTTKSIVSVYCMGDSLTWGYGTYNGYEGKLSSLLGAGWAVVNKGMGAQITSQMVSRFDTDIIANDPDWVIIWAGVNDVLNTTESAADIEANLQAMYSDAHHSGIFVVAVSISPTGVTLSRQEVLHDVNNWIANTATDVDFRIDVYSQLEDPARPFQLLPAYDYGDHIHLTNAGYDLVGQTIYDVVNWNLG